MEIIIKPESNVVTAFFSGVWLLGWLFMLGVLIVGIVIDPEKFDGEFIVILIIFFSAGIFVLRLFLWNTIGKEKIEITDKFLTIKKMGTILSGKKRYEIENIENMSYRTSIPWWYRSWMISGGKIEFDYYGNKKYFGETPSKYEAIKIINDINSFIGRSSNGMIE